MRTVTILVLANNTTLGKKIDRKDQADACVPGCCLWLPPCLTVMASPLSRHPCEWIISAPRTEVTREGRVERSMGLFKDGGMVWGGGGTLNL